MHLKMGKTVAADGIPAKDGFDLPRGAGASGRAKRKAIIPDPRNDENLAVAQTHLAMIRFHNRVLDTPARLGPAGQRFATARELVTKHYQWMIRTDYLPRICRPSAVNNVFNQRPQGVRGRRHADRRADDADRVLASPPSGSATRWSAPPTTGTRSSTTAPARSTCCSRSPPPAATSAAACGCRATGSPTSAASTTSGEAGKPNLGRAGGQVQPREGDRHAARRPAAQPAAVHVRRARASRRRPAAQPRVPQPDPRADGPARDRPADGDVHEEQGRELPEAHQGADPRRQRRRRARQR